MLIYWEKQIYGCRWVRVAKSTFYDSNMVNTLDRLGASWSGIWVCEGRPGYLFILSSNRHKEQFCSHCDEKELQGPQGDSFRNLHVLGFILSSNISWPILPLITCLVKILLPIVLFCPHTIRLSQSTYCLILFSFRLLAIALNSSDNGIVQRPQTDVCRVGNITVKAYFLSR